MRMLPSFAAAVPALVLLASCVGPAEQGQRPAPRPAHSVPAPAQHGPRPEQAPRPAALVSAEQPAEWQYRSVAQGTWTYRAEPAATLALFGPAGTEPRLTVRCDRTARRISLIRAGAGSNPGQIAMTVRTSFGAQSWPATTNAAQTIAVRAASDTALDQIAYSRGKFMVEVQGVDPLIVPAWAEVARVIEDCRG